MKRSISIILTVIVLSLPLFGCGLTDDIGEAILINTKANAVAKVQPPTSFEMAMESSQTPSPDDYGGEIGGDSNVLLALVVCMTVFVCLGFLLAYLLKGPDFFKQRRLLHKQMNPNNRARRSQPQLLPQPQITGAWQNGDGGTPEETPIQIGDGNNGRLLTDGSGSNGWGR